MVLTSTRDIAYVLFRHKWKSAGFALAIMVIITGVAFVLPVAYRSEAGLLIRVGRENMPGDLTVQSAMVNATQDRTSEVKSIVAIMTSHYIAEKTVDTIGEGWILERPELRREDVGLPEPEPLSTPKKILLAVKDGLKDGLIYAGLKVEMTPYEEAVEAVTENLQVEVEKQTNIVDVHYLGETPELAHVVLRTLIDIYLERHIEVFAQQATPKFFADQSNDLAGQLAEKEAELDVFRHAHGIASLDAQKQVLLERISDLEKELGATEAEARASSALVGALDKELSGRSKTMEVSRVTGRTNFAADSLKEKLIDLKNSASEMSSRYPETHRPLAELRRQIAETDSALSREAETRTEVTTGIDETYLSLEHRVETERTELAANEARTAALEHEIAGVRGELTALTSRETDLQRLERDKGLLEAEYRTYRGNLQKARLATAMDLERVSNVSMVQPASLPAEPDGGSKVRIIALGIIMGVFGGICLAFVLEFLDDRIHTPESAERRLGIPVLAALTEEEFKACT